MVDDMINSAILNTLDKISSFFPNDFNIRLILVCAAITIAFGFVNIVYGDEEEKKENKKI